MTLTYEKVPTVPGSQGYREIRALNANGKVVGLLWTYADTSATKHPWHAMGGGKSALYDLPVAEHKVFYARNAGGPYTTKAIALLAAKAYIERILG